MCNISDWSVLVSWAKWRPAHTGLQETATTTRTATWRIIMCSSTNSKKEHFKQFNLHEKNVLLWGIKCSLSLLPCIFYKSCHKRANSTYCISLRQPKKNRILTDFLHRWHLKSLCIGQWNTNCNIKSWNMVNLNMKEYRKFCGQMHSCSLTSLSGLLN